MGGERRDLVRIAGAALTAHTGLRPGPVGCQPRECDSGVPRLSGHVATRWADLAHVGVPRLSAPAVRRGRIAYTPDRGPPGAFCSRFLKNDGTTADKR